MSRPTGTDEGLRALATHVLDDGKAYVQAEIAVVRAIVAAKVDLLRPVAILLVVALLLVQAGLTTLAIALGVALARWLGPAGGMAVGAVLVLALAGLLALNAVGRLKKAF